MKFDPTTGEFIPDNDQKKHSHDRPLTRDANRNMQSHQQVRPRSLTPSRLWPETVLGNLFYLAVISGTAFSFSQFAPPNQEVPPFAPMISAIGGAVSAIMILTFWRNIMIAVGVLKRRQVVVDENGIQHSQGGFGFRNLLWLILWLLLGAALSIVTRAFIILLIIAGAGPMLRSL